VTAALTILAVASVSIGAALTCCGGSRARAVTAANLDRPRGQQRPHRACHGQMGSGELNYSSDIADRLFDPPHRRLAGFEPQRFCRAGDAGAVAAAVSRAPRRLFVPGRSRLRLIRLDASGDIERPGAVLLRKGGKGGPGTRGHIKARPAPGTPGCAALWSRLAPFVLAKHLDFAALCDVHDMRRPMQAFCRGQSDRGRGP